jgi:hypothetical protein
VFDDLTPESGGFGREVFVFLLFGALQGVFVFVEYFFVEVADVFFQDLVDELVHVFLQFVGVFYVALHQYGEAEHSSVVVGQTHHDVAELFFCPEVIEGGFFDEG